MFLLEGRSEWIRALETQKDGNLQRKLIILVDNDGVKLKFLLWGEQVMLSNLFRYLFGIQICCFCFSTST